MDNQHARQGGDASVQLLLVALVFIAMALVGWMALGRLGFVTPPQWHPQAAWQTLRHGLSSSVPSSGIHPAHLQRGPHPHLGRLAQIPGEMAHDLWLWSGLAGGGLILGWLLWGTAVWLYNTPAAVRTAALWGDWLLWRWPVVTMGQLTGHPDWVQDAWARHKRQWQTTAAPTGEDGLAHVAAILRQGFETSHGDVVWQTMPDGAQFRRMTIVADAVGIHPQWSQGFHADTMQTWVQWATQWAEIALHHAGVPGAWSVDAEGVVRQGRPGSVASTATVPLAATPAPPSSDPQGIAPTTRWGAQGLPWSVLMGIAPQPLPVLAADLPADRARDVVQVLDTLGIPGTEPVGGQRGLAVDVVEVRPTPALASRLLAGSMATALAGQLGHGETPLRVHYVDNKPGIIAVERPRPNRQFVDVVTALARTTPKDRKSLTSMALSVCVGVTPDGHVLWSDAATWPHLLVGGTTGGGKTTALVAWLASLMVTTPPSDLRLTLVDPKAGSQFPWANHVPHVETLLTKPQEVCALVAQWADEQEARYEAFRDAGVMDVYAARKAGLGSYPLRLLVVDEYKDLKDQLDKEDLKELERNIGRIGQKARGAGLFLWIATQHPLAETISSTLKNNLPARLALRVTSTSASQVVLDEPGAETLLGTGDAFFRPGDGRMLVRIQTPAALDDALWLAIAQGW